MGRRKLEMKPIEDKTSRQVTFSKRKAGLNKKARQLSVLCDVDIAVVVFSSRGKLYESCSGSTDRYQKRCLETEGRSTTQEVACTSMAVNSTSTRFRTCKELLQSVRRLDEVEGNEEVMSVTEMTELEEELSEALMHTRSRKTQLMMERRSSFHQQERKLTEEKEELKSQVESAKQRDSNIEDGATAGGLNDFATNLIHQHQHQLPTLPLFKD